MLGFLIAITGAAIPLLIDEFLYRQKVSFFQPEDRRKFVHITVGAYVAAWPWITTWQNIQIIAALMFIGVYLNRRYDIFKFSKGIGRLTLGEYYFALAILLTASFTTNKIFFAIAIFNMALSDGAAALAGKHLGGNYKYKVFGQTKTVIGTMTFWVSSLCVIAIGGLYAHDTITLPKYLWLIAFLPPILAALESVSVYGTDDLIVPLATLAALSMA